MELGEPMRQIYTPPFFFRVHLLAHHGVNRPVPRDEGRP